MYVHVQLSVLCTVFPCLSFLYYTCRCCCAYKALEGQVKIVDTKKLCTRLCGSIIFQAIVELLNGVEVLVCTPTSLLRLIDKTVANLKELTHLVSKPL